jgi:hypothetical protein
MKFHRFDLEGVWYLHGGKISIKISFPVSFLFIIIIIIISRIILTMEFSGGIGEGTGSDNEG